MQFSILFLPLHLLFVRHVSRKAAGHAIMPGLHRVESLAGTYRPKLLCEILLVIRKVASDEPQVRVDLF